jgi:membrane-bound lytic murein transglycosylase D
LVAHNQKAPKATAASKPKPAKAAKATAAAKSAPKYYVVKPDETLYRVALNNGISVAQLRKLNRLGPNDNTIRAGQRLKVGS